MSAATVTPIQHAVRKPPTRSGLLAGVGRRSVRRLLLMAAFVLIWEIAARTVGNPAKLPAPSLIVQTGLPMFSSGELGGHIAASLRRVLMGFAAAAIVAIPIGLLSGTSAVVRRIVYPLLEVFRPIPALAMLPVFLAFLGIGEALAISIVFFAAFFPILIAAQDGVRDANRIYQEAALTLGARPWHVATEVILPSALPRIFTGLRLGLQFGWMSIVGAEFIGATNGLGFMILYYGKFLDTDKVIVGMAVIGVLGLLLDRLLVLLARPIASLRMA